ncbi:MAG: ATP synthase F1 subunit delta [Candidatus Cloacimonadota bacterium]|nr:ATP synthase F1 subunit delta [Candidatus Cloacimonadota bacterium]
MKHKLIAQRYSRAILKLIDEKEFSKLYDDVRSLQQICKEIPEQLKILDSMLISFSKRKVIGEELCKNLKFKQIWKNLIHVLIHKHRVEILPDICDEIENHILSIQNKQKVTLKVAHKHPQETIDIIVERLRKILQKEIILNLVIEPKIVGGFMAETESLRIDGSIKNNLIKFVNMKSKKRG